MAQQYDVIHVEKQSGGVSSRMEHEEDRTEKETKNADINRAGLNFAIHAVPDPDDPELAIPIKDKLKWSPLTKQQRLDECLARQKTIEITDKNGRKYTKSATIRKDAVTHFNLLISGSHDTMHQMLLDDIADYRAGKRENFPRRISEWAEDNFKWLAEKAGGADNIVTFNVHLDETTPHIQATICPMYGGRLNGKKFVNGPDGMKKLRTDHHKKVGEKYGLERGIEGSKAQHQSIRQFYRDIQRAENSQKVNEKVKADFQTLGYSKEELERMISGEQVGTNWSIDAAYPKIDGTPPVMGRDAWVKEQNERLEKEIKARDKRMADGVAKWFAGINQHNQKAKAALLQAVEDAAPVSISERNRLRTENSQLKAQLRNTEKELDKALHPEQYQEPEQKQEVKQDGGFKMG